MMLVTSFSRKWSTLIPEESSIKLFFSCSCFSLFLSSIHPILRNNSVYNHFTSYPKNYRQYDVCSIHDDYALCAG